LWWPREAKPEFSVADLATPLADSRHQVPWGETPRGSGKGERAKVEQQTFQAGVAILNLQVALSSQDRAAASTAASQVCRVLGIGRDKTGHLISDLDFLNSSITGFYGDLPGRLANAQQEPQSFAKFTREAAERAEALRSSGSLDRPYF